MTTKILMCVCVLCGFHHFTKSADSESAPGWTSPITDSPLNRSHEYIVIASL